MVVGIERSNAMSDWVWRVENDDGFGPYSNRATWSETRPILCSHQGDYVNHPTPYTDSEIGRIPEPQESCGFISEEQMRQWFTEDELKKLAELGFQVKQVQGTITAIGKKQVLFIKS
jgi:hypothetical protein